MKKNPKAKPVGVEIWNFQVLKKYLAISRGYLNKNNMEFPGLIKRKSCGGISRCFGFRP